MASKTGLFFFPPLGCQNTNGDRNKINTGQSFLWQISSSVYKHCALCMSFILHLTKRTNILWAPASGPPLPLLTVTTIRRLIVDKDDKGNCRIPWQGICILTGEKAEPSWEKKKKRKREHAMFEQRLRGAGVLICACEEVGVGPCLEERAKSLLWSLVFHLS